MKVELINHLLDAGYMIVRITDNEAVSEYSWFIADEFTPATPNSVEPIMHNYIKGIEVTDFLKQTMNMESRNVFKKALQTFLERETTETISMQFSINMSWKKYLKIFK